MKRYFKLFIAMFKIAWISNMEYRANFILGLTIDICWTIADLIFFTVLMQNVQAIGSWTQAETLIMVGLYRLLGVFVWGWMQPSFERIPTFINNGQLDLILTKPIDSQFLLSFHQYSMNLVSSLVGGIVMIAVGLSLRGGLPSLPVFILFCWVFLVSIFLAYGVYFLTMTVSLFVDRLNNIVYLFQSMYDTARYPREIYGYVMQRMMISVVPLALMIGMSSDVLFGRASLGFLVWFHLLAIGFFFLGRSVWKVGLRRYSSASS